MEEFVFQNGYDEFPSIFGNDVAPKKQKNSIFEEAGADMSGAEDFAEKQMKSQGMSCALQWIDGGDFSISALDGLIQGFADLDGDGEVESGGDEENYYNDLYGAVADALASLGADPGDITKFIDDEDDATGEAIGSMLAEKLNAVQQSDDGLVSNYVMESADDHVMESMVKVVRNGKIVLKKKRLQRAKLSSAQRAGLKEARMKAFTSVAKHARAKSMKLREKRGL